MPTLQQEIRKHSQWFFWLFVLVVLGEFVVLIQFPEWEIYSKPLLMPALALFFVSKSPTVCGRLKAWVLAALFFCWLGDVLLLFEGQAEMFFIFGLIAFLLGHILYVISFQQSTKGRMHFSLIWIFFFISYGVMVLNNLWDHLNGMKLPVSLYAIVISLMALTATARTTVKRSYYQVFFGAVLFMFSDTIIAFNKFMINVPFASVFIMATYLLGQWLIIRGILWHMIAVKTVRK
jgi:uncharacterized membrane protein YhhN